MSVKLTHLDERGRASTADVGFEGPMLTQAAAEGLPSMSLEARGAPHAFDAAQSADRGARTGPIRLLERRGGKSGHFRRSSHVHAAA